MKETENPFKNYTPRKRLNMPYEIRKIISQLVDKPLPQILGYTKGMTERQLKGCLVDAEADAKRYNIPVGARIWSILKELKENNKR